MTKGIALTITEEEYAELEALLDTYAADTHKDNGEHEPTQQPGYRNLDDRAKLEVWLDALVAQRHADKGEHERAMERVDRNLAAIKANLEFIRNSREASCGKKLLEVVQEVFDLRRQVRGHDKRLDELTGSTRHLSEEQRLLSERVLRLELQLEYQKAQQAADRENFRLQIENLILRMQRGLPPPDLPEKPDDQ